MEMDTPTLIALGGFASLILVSIALFAYVYTRK